MDRLQNSLVSRIVGVEQSLASIEDRVVANEAVVQRVLDAPAVSQSSDATLNTCMSEVADRKQRKANLHLHGLADSDVHQSDLTNIRSFLAALVDAPVNVLRCQRLGTFAVALAKPRPILITLDNDTTAKLILQAIRVLHVDSSQAKIPCHSQSR